MSYTIDGTTLREMIFAGAINLENNRKIIDALNVFPVPDGDTGTNMSQTMNAAVKEIKAMGQDPKVHEVAGVLARGSLKGARGDSGVILSQLFRGLAKAVEGKDEIDAHDFAEALQSGVQMSYKAVLKPKEGTMLTVARVVADAAKAHADAGGNVLSLMDVLVEVGGDILRKTPDMLPVLKQAGVVDSGGKGLLAIYTGFKLAMDGEAVVPVAPLEMEEGIVQQGEASVFQSLEDIQYGYCTEIIVEHIYDYVRIEDIDKLRSRLEKLGDSLVMAGDLDLIKVHVHTDMPGKVLQFGLALGELTAVKIENMRQQNRELVAHHDHHTIAEMPEIQQEPKEVGVVAVATGEGLVDIFNSMAVDAVINGGQTANPSIESIAEAVNRVNAHTVFVLPNNKNIVLAAQQAVNLTDKNVVVIPTTTIPQGIAAMLAYNSEMSVEENQARMAEAPSAVKSGSITFAIRDSHFNGIDIKTGDIMGIQEDAIRTVGKNVAEVAMELLDRMIDEDDELVTVIYGQAIALAQAQELAAKLEEKYPDCEFVLHNGNQPLYHYIFSVE